MHPDDRREPHVPAASGLDPKADRSVGELFHEAATDLGILLSTQIDLAKLELREEAVRAGRAASLLSAGAAAAVMTALLLSFAAAWGIAEALDSPALGFLIVGALYAIGAAVLLLRGRDRMRQVSMVPQQTVEALRGDVEWAKQQMR
jgi:hypothetical protein